MTCFCWPSLMLGLFGLSVNSLPTLIRPPYCTYIRILRNSCQQKYKHDPCRVSCLTSFSTISSLFKLLSCSLISISINQFKNFPFESYQFLKVCAAVKQILCCRTRCDSTRAPTSMSWQSLPGRRWWFGLAGLGCWAPRNIWIIRVGCWQ